MVDLVKAVIVGRHYPKQRFYWDTPATVPEVMEWLRDGPFCNTHVEFEYVGARKYPRAKKINR